MSRHCGSSAGAAPGHALGGAGPARAVPPPPFLASCFFRLEEKKISKCIAPISKRVAPHLTTAVCSSVRRSSVPPTHPTPTRRSQLYIPHAPSPLSISVNLRFQIDAFTYPDPPTPPTLEAPCALSPCVGTPATTHAPHQPPSTTAAAAAHSLSPYTTAPMRHGVAGWSRDQSTALPQIQAN